MNDSSENKIYLVSIQYPPNITGGGGVIVRELSRELVKTGNDVEVLCFGLKDKKKEMIILSDSDGDFKIPVIRFFADDSRKLKNPYEGSKEDEFKRFEQFTKKVFSYLKDKEGLIHLHGHYIIPFLAKKIKTEGKKNPTIISYHALESIALEAKEIQDETAFKYIRKKEEESLKFCDLAIVNSKRVKNQLKELFPKQFRDEKVVVIPNPVNNELIFKKESTPQEKFKNREKFGIPANSHILFSIGRIDKIKGYDILIDALKYIGEEISAEISLIIAGFLEKKNEEYFGELEKAAKKINLKHPNIKIIFIPNISNEEKIIFLDDCISFISAAILEPFGITSLESWIRGKPVITSETEGSKDLFNINKSINPPFEIKNKGLIVSYQGKKSKNLAQALTYLLTNLEAARKMGKEGKKFVLNNFTWKKIVGIYKKYYQSIF
ncbi:MAG: glycosyltransferase family 4 protein [Candidatus Helarchaeota archaeon]